MSERAIAKGHSLHLSVNLFVRYTPDPRLNGTGYRNIFHTIRQSDVSSFLSPNFVFVSLECVRV